MTLSLTSQATNNGEDIQVSMKDGVTVKGTGNIAVSLERLGSRPLHIELDVEMQPCPPGFVFNYEDKNCSCPEMDNEGLTNCDDKLKVAVMTANYWMGLIPNQSYENLTYYMASCPMYLCSRKGRNFQMLPNSSSALSDQLCNPNRKGVLCGECKDGFCLSINSLTHDCITEPNSMNLASSITKYIASAYIPLAVMLFLLFLFHIELATGSLNAFILFSQMIATTFDLTHHDDKTLNKHLQHFPNVYRFPYGAFNLDFVEKYIGNFCFSSELNILSVLLLNYLLFVVPLATVFATASVIKISKHLSRKKNVFNEEKQSMCGCCEHILKYFRGLTETLGRNVIQLVATICLLSYSKLSTTSVHILHVKHLISISDGKREQRVYLAGQLEVENGQYYNYKIPAILCEIYLIIFILLLLDYPLRLVEMVIKQFKLLKMLANPFNTIHLFADSFQKSFKAKYKFFAGFYFIFRYAVSITHVTSGPSVKKYVVQELSCIIMLLLLVLCKPYRQNKHNYTDIMVFANLAVINGLNHYQHDIFLKTTSKSISSFVFSVQFILVLLPAICLVICVAIKAINTHTRGTKYLLHKAFTNILKEKGVELENKWLHTAKEMTPEEGDAASDDAAPNHEKPSNVAVRRKLNPRAAGNVRNLNKNIQTSRDDSIPVTVAEVCDKTMGEADMFQTSESEGYYLRNEWNSGRASYGATGKGGKA